MSIHLEGMEQPEGYGASKRRVWSSIHHSGDDATVDSIHLLSTLLLNHMCHAQCDITYEIARVM